MKEDLEKQLNAVQTAPVSEKWAEYLKYCRMCIEAVNRNELSIEDASYKVCGISAKTSNALPENQEDIRNIMDIACDLELPAADRDRPLDDWDKLVQRVSELSSKKN